MSETIDIRRHMLSSLTKAIQSSDEGVRAWSAWILSQIGVQATPILIRLLKEAETGRCEAVWAAGEIGRDARTMIPILLQILEESREIELCYEIIVTLGKMGSVAKEAVPNLLQFFYESTQEDLCEELIRTLGKIGSPEVVPALVRLVRSSDSSFHPEIISALGEIGKTRVDAVIALCRLLPQCRLEIQQEIIRTLGDLGYSAEEAIPTLLDILNAPHTELRQITSKALSQIRKSIVSAKTATRSKSASLSPISLDVYISAS